MVAFKYGNYAISYYQSRHAVDDKNNNSQGRLYFEDTYLLRNCEHRQFGFIVAIADNKIKAENVHKKIQQAVDDGRTANLGTPFDVILALNALDNVVAGTADTVPAIPE